MEEPKMNSTPTKKERRQARQQKPNRTENNYSLCEEQRNMNLTSCEDTPVLSQCHLKQHFCMEPVSSAENAHKPYRGHNRLNGCASFTTEVSHDPLLDIIAEYEPKDAKCSSESYPQKNEIEECAMNAISRKEACRSTGQ